MPIPGNPPSLLNLPSGCTFHPRCRFTRPRCPATVPHRVPELCSRLAGPHGPLPHRTAEARRRSTQTEIKPRLQPRSDVERIGSDDPHRRTRSTHREDAARRRCCGSTDLQKHFPSVAAACSPRGRRPRAGGRRHLLRAPAAARRSGSSASPAAASRPPAAPAAAARPDRRHDRVRRRGHHPRRHGPSCAAAPRDADDLPGPLRLAEPPAHGRLDHRARRSTSRASSPEGGAQGACRT